MGEIKIRPISLADSLDVVEFMKSDFLKVRTFKIRIRIRISLNLLNIPDWTNVWVRRWITGLGDL